MKCPRRIPAVVAILLLAAPSAASAGILDRIGDALEGFLDSIERAVEGIFDGTEAPPTSEPPPPSSDAEPDEPWRYEAPGVFHMPTLENPVRRFSFRFPRGLVYRRIRLAMDVRHGGWHTEVPDGIHNLFLLVRNEYRGNTFGYVNARGPRRNLFYLAHYVGPAGLERAVERFALEPGHRYHLSYRYDTIDGIVSARIRDLASGRQSEVSDRTTVDRIVTQGRGFRLDVGRRRIHNDVPTYGWEYADLVLEFLP